ncbi:Alpha galactosidase A [Eubacterium ruminantium]|nr:Alpha galactosidase A [Eubacterium ruminantium]
MNKNDFAPVPPMGWNSYDYYDTTVTEADVKRNADYMADNLKRYGWEYVIVDIEWYAAGAGSRRNEYQYIPFSKLYMDEYSRLLPDPERFPSSKDGNGFKPLADYVHGKGLKFGIHIMRGIPRNAAHAHGRVLGTDIDASDIADPSSICRWNPDMYGVRNTDAGQAYYDSIISLYADWGVDYIKCDDICNTNMYPHDPYSGRHEIEMLAEAIEKSGRPIVLSLSPGPALIEHAWHYEKYANMWRITDDLWDQWPLLKEMFWRCELWEKHVSRGCYPDCDMLPLGVMGKGFGHEWKCNLTYDEQKTMLTLWCIFGSPLMIGSELPLLDRATLKLLTNEKVLSMQTPDAKPHQINRTDLEAVWEAVNDKTGEHFMALFNLTDSERRIEVLCSEASKKSVEQDSFKDFWTGDQIEADGEVISAVVPAHGCKVFMV